MITVIEFEDHGQDFRRWIVGSNGRVIESSPMQSDVWAGCRVLNLDELMIGMGVTIESSGGRPLTLSYPVEDVFTLHNLAYRKGAA